MHITNKIATLWVVVLFNMAFADIVGFAAPGAIEDIMALGTDGANFGSVEGVAITPVFLVIAGVFIELSILMIYLSKSLPRKINRIANSVVAVLTGVFIIGGGSATPHYIFFASFEVAALFFIVMNVWGWTEDE
ncbi:MAG: DUF6326 family protein [Pseudomonadota bacterium]